MMMKTFSFAIMFVLLASMFIPVAKAVGDVPALPPGDDGSSDLPALVPSDHPSRTAGDIDPPTLSFNTPIEIGSDADLEAFALAHYYPGNGSAANPFVIDGLFIGLQYNDYGTALFIHDTTLYFVISNSTFNDGKFFSTPYQIGAGLLVSNVKNALIVHCRMNNDIEGIKIVGSSNVVIRSCAIVPYQYSAVCLDIKDCHDIVIRDSDMQAAYYNTVVANIISCTSCTFENNTLGGHSAHVESSDGNRFLNNSWSNSNDDCLDLKSSDNNLVMGNTFGYARSDEVYTIDSLNNRFLNNDFIGYSYMGICLSTSPNAQISGNNLAGINFASIYVENGGSDLIYNNTISSSLKGIYLQDAHDETVLKNNISECGYAAIDLTGGLVCKIYGNTLVHDSIHTDSAPEYLSTYEIPTNNTVNGGPVYYYLNVNSAGADVPHDAGQVIVASSSNLWVHGLALTEQNFGILVLYGSSLLVEDNHLSGMDQEGMSFSLCSDLIIQDNHFVNFNLGIYIFDSSLSNVLRNTMADCYNAGITLTSCQHMKVQDNVIGRCENAGISINTSPNCWLYSNLMTGSSVYVIGSGTNDYSTLDIPINNTVNGRPVYYYNTDDVVVPLLAGEVILGGVSHADVLGLNLSDQDVGLVVGFSDDVLVEGCVFHNNTDYGATFVQSYDVTVRNNQFGQIGTGVYIQQSHDMLVERNNITGTEEGLYVLLGQNIVVQGNNLTNFYMGLYSQECTYLTVTRNCLDGDHQEYGVYLRTVTQSSVDNNTLSGSSYGLFYDTVGSTVTENNSIADCTYGMYFYSSNSLRIQYNQLEDDQYGIRLESLASSLVIGNQFGSTPNGISITNCPDQTIQGNRFADSGTGIDVGYNSQGCLVEGNDFTACVIGVNIGTAQTSMIGNTVKDTQTAFQVAYDQDKALISGNQIINCSVGVYLSPYCDDCVITGNHLEQVYGAGIEIVMAHNALVTGNEISGPGTGVLASGGSSYDIVQGHISKNVISMGGNGIQINAYATFEMFGNHLNTCLGDGIMLSSSTNNSIYGNILSHCSIDITGDVNAFRFQDIPDNNTVNGRPVHYYSSENATSVIGIYAPAGSGELIYGNVHGFIVDGLALDNQTVALLTGYCHDFDVHGCTFSDVTVNAFRAQNCEYISVQSNKFLKDRIGLNIDGSSQLTVCIDNFAACQTGVRLGGSFNTIYSNVLKGCGDGIYSISSNNDVHDNSFVNNTNSGYFGEWSGDQLQSNTFCGSPYGAYFEHSPMNVYGNGFDHCGYGIYGLQSSGTVSDSTITECRIGVGVYGDSGSYIENNHVSGCSGSGIVSSAFYGDAGQSTTGYWTYISGNEIADCSNGTVLVGTYGCQLASNIITGCHVGILINSSQENQVQDNQVQGSYDGMIIGTSSSVAATSNTISGSAHVGISVMSSHGVQVTSNLIDGSGSYGLLSNLSYGCTINTNRFIGNNGAGAVYSAQHIQAYDDGYVYADHDPPVFERCNIYDGTISTTGNVGFRWYVSDAGSGTASSAIRLDGGSWVDPRWRDQGEGDDYWRADSAFYGLAEGKHLFEICATDLSGNQAFKFVNVTVDFDYAGPVFDEWGPSDCAQVGMYDYLEWWVYEGDSSITGCVLLIDGKGVADFEFTQSGYEWYGESSDLSAYDLAYGHHQFEISVTDADGNVANITLNLLLSDIESSPAPGKGGNGGHAGGPNAWNTEGLGNYWSDWLSPDVQRDSIVDLPYQITGGVSDKMPLAYLTAIPFFYNHEVTDDHVSLWWDVNYTLIGSDGYQIFRNSSYGNEVFTVTGTQYYDDEAVAPYGIYDYCLRVNDNGFVGRTSATLNVQVPEYVPPDLEITAPEDGSTVGQAHVTWIGSDAGSGIDHYEVCLNGGDWVNVGTATGYTFTNAPEGENHVQVKAVDVAGNEIQEQADFYLDRTGPVMEIDSPHNGHMYNAGEGNDVQFEWGTYDEASEVSSVWMVINGGDPADVTGEYGQMEAELADGHYNVTFYAVDALGNRGANSSVEFTVDTLAPTISMVDPVDNGWIGESTHTFVWTAQDGGSGISGYEVYLDGQDMGWTEKSSMKLTGMTAAKHNLAVDVYDRAGNLDYAYIHFSVDLNVPELVIIYPSEMMAFNSGSHIPVEWEAFDEGSGIQHTEVRMDGGAPIDVGVNSTHMFTGAADGYHTITVVTYDHAGLSFEALLTIVIDSTSPVLTITSPTSGGYSHNSDVTVTWQAHDATTGIAMFEYYLDSAEIAAPYGSSLQLRGLTDGVHTFMVYAFDDLDNQVSASVTFTVDTAAPSVALIAPVDGSLTNAANCHFAWTGGDGGSGLAGFRYSVDGAAWSELVTVHDVTLPGIADGVHSFQVKAIDLAGNSATATVGFTVDRTVPALAITSDVEGAHYGQIAGNSVSVSWSGSDTGSGVAYYLFRLNGAEIANQTTTTMYLPDLPDGHYRFDVRAYDRAGNMVQRSLNITVDMISPTLTIESPAGTCNSTAIGASWTGSDPASGIAGYQYSLDGAAWSSVGSLSEAVLEGVNDGVHSFQVKAIDNAGNSAFASVEFIVDATSPALDITSPAPGSYFNHTAGNDVTITWSATDAGEGMDHYLVRMNGGGWAEQTAANLSLHGLEDGPYRIDVRAVDAAGNVAERSVGFTVDLTPPTLAITSPTAATYNVDSFGAAWTGGDAVSGLSGFRFRMDSGAWSEMNAANVADLASLTQGEHVLTVQAMDAAGNTNERSVTFSVDSVKPTVTGFGPAGADVAVDGKVTVTFSEAMNQSSVVITIDGATGTVTWEGNAVTFAPGSPLAHLLGYTVSVSGNDLAGNPVSKSWSFTTIAYQGSLRGVLRDANGVPMANAHVVLSNGQNTTTDANGSFEFTNLAPGGYNMTISRDGYADTMMELTLGADQINDIGAVNVDMKQITSTNWMPFVMAGILSVIVGLFLIVMVRRRKK